MTRWTILACALAACGGKEQRTQASAAAALDAAAVAVVEASVLPAVTLDGQPLALRGGVARAGAQRVELILTATDVTCGDVDLRVLDDDRLSLEVLRRLGADGSWTWAIGAVGWARELFDATRDARVDGVAIDAARVRVEVHAEARPGAVGDPLLVAAGVVDVARCPDDAPAQPPAQPDAHLEVEGQVLPIVGAAFVVGPSGSMLTVSTVALQCEPLGKAGRFGARSAVWPLGRAPLAVDVVREAGEPVTRLHGTWFAASVDGAGLRHSPERPPAGADTVTVELDGRGELRGYDASWRGTVEAIVCR